MKQYIKLLSFFLILLFGIFSCKIIPTESEVANRRSIKLRIINNSSILIDAVSFEITQNSDSLGPVFVDLDAGGIIDYQTILLLEGENWGTSVDIVFWSMSNSEYNNILNYIDDDFENGTKFTISVDLSTGKFLGTLEVD